MPSEPFVSGRIREIPFGWQAFIFVVLSQALKYFAMIAEGDIQGLSPRNLTLIALLFVPFVLARIPLVLAVTPGLFLRKEARIDLHRGGLVYTFDGVKRPLFVEWPDLEYLHKTRFGLVLKVRNRANVTEAMPKFQAQFWRSKIRKPIRLLHVSGLDRDGAALWPCLAAARRAGVEIRGFDRDHSHQGSMAAISSSDQPK